MLCEGAAGEADGEAGIGDAGAGDAGAGEAGAGDGVATLDTALPGTTDADGAGEATWRRGRRGGEPAPPAPAVGRPPGPPSVNPPPAARHSRRLVTVVVPSGHNVWVVAAYVTVTSNGSSLQA